jgi:aryl-alcohol dehydrogenase-like predicted oxidoreductase
MEYRILGKTGLKVSVVGVGTWQFGGEWGHDFTQAEADSIIRAAKEEGINLIDTAECYGDHLSEELVGTAIKGEREDWIVATKFGHKFHDRFDRTRHYTAEGVRKSVEESLKALQTDYIDLLQFHSGSDEEFDTEGLWEECGKLVDEGTVKALGISIGSNQNIYQTRKAEDVNAGAIQVIYNRLDKGPEAEVFPECKRQNLGVLARVPLASGFLSGKYKPGHKFGDKNDVRSRREQEQIDERLREVEDIARNEVPEGVDMASWALAWCLKNPLVTTVIPGCKNPGQVRSNAAAVRLL